MTQVELALPPAEEPPHEDPTGFCIGWDHAHHGLVPPAELLLEGTPIGQGWRAARTVFGAGSRTWPATRHTRQWLALRIEAWRAGVAFELATVTPNHLAQIEVAHCPVLRCALGGAADAPGAPRIERLNAQAAYAAGNLVVLSRRAALAWRGLSVADLVRRARTAEVAASLAMASTQMPVLDLGAAGTDSGMDEDADADGVPGADAAVPHTPAMDAPAWWRLATLRSLATPLPAAEAARLPLAVLPPNRVRVLNSVQALQALLTQGLMAPDWCARISAVAATLPEHSLRTDFNLWVGAVAPRLLEAQALGRPLAQALGDAWLAERVQRRWLHFALSLGEPACEQLVLRLARNALPGRTARAMPMAQALDGWQMPQPQADPPTKQATKQLAEQPPRQPPWQPPRQVPGQLPQRGGPAECELSAAARAAPAPPADHRRTARTPYSPRPRATAAPRPAAR